MKTITMKIIKVIIVFTTIIILIFVNLKKLSDIIISRPNAVLLFYTYTKDYIGLLDLAGTPNITLIESREVFPIKVQ